MMPLYDPTLPPKDRPGRHCNVGDKVKTDFSGHITYHTITDREVSRCQSGIVFMLHPVVPGSGGGWIDADWFIPANLPEYKSHDR